MKIFLCSKKLDYCLIKVSGSKKLPFYPLSISKQTHLGPQLDLFHFSNLKTIIPKKAPLLVSRGTLKSVSGLKEFIITALGYSGSSGSPVVQSAIKVFIPGQAVAVGILHSGHLRSQKAKNHYRYSVFTPIEVFRSNLTPYLTGKIQKKVHKLALEIKKANSLASLKNILDRYKALKTNYGRYLFIRNVFTHRNMIIRQKGHKLIPSTDNAYNY